MKHAASVRPEPGSNSPLSESFIVSIRSFKQTALTHFFTYAWLSPYVFCLCEIIFFRINKYYVSSSAILFSMFKFLLCVSRSTAHPDSRLSVSPPSFPPALLGASLPSVSRAFLSYHLNFFCQAVFYFFCFIFFYIRKNRCFYSLLSTAFKIAFIFLSF